MRIYRQNIPPISGGGARLNLKGKQVTTERELGLRLKKLLSEKSLSEVLRVDFPFSSFGALSRIAAGIFPKRPEVRVRFGLPPMVSIAGCPNCGGAHSMRACRPKRPQATRRKCEVAWVLGVAEKLKQMEVEKWTKKT